VTASNEHENCQATNVINGLGAQVAGTMRTSGPRRWVETARGWNWRGTSRNRLRQVQLTFDSGFIRELTLSSSAAANVTSFARRN